MSANWKTQVGKSNYSSLKIQPLEFTAKYGLPPSMCKVIKYLLRDRGVCKLEDYAKVRDCLKKGADLNKRFPNSYKAPNLMQIHDELSNFYSKEIVSIINLALNITFFVYDSCWLYSSFSKEIACFEDETSMKFGYREAKEGETPDLDYTSFGGRKWVKIFFLCNK